MENGLERTLAFLTGETLERPPFHPIIMRWAARYAAVTYRDFCLVPEVKAAAMVKAARDFSMDWATVMSDPWAEVEAFGMEIEYPENALPLDRGGHLAELEDGLSLRPYDPRAHLRTRNRLEEIRLLRQMSGDRLFVVGWVEGPVSAYVNLRTAGEAAMDMVDDPELVGQVMDVIVEGALRFITLQVEAGAHAVGIGDAFCSQIGPGLYQELAWEREKKLVDHIHSLGAKAKLHICGNTSPILGKMIETGADIVDIDHLVGSMAAHAGSLGPGQVFSGQVDPVAVVQNGTAESIAVAVADCRRQAPGRVITSAGCEVPPGASEANMHAFSRA